jgi:hypothetical protein
MSAEKELVRGRGIEFLDFPFLLRAHVPGVYVKMREEKGAVM